MTLHATPDQLERLIEAGKALAFYTNALARSFDESSDDHPYIKIGNDDEKVMYSKANDFNAICAEIKSANKDIWGDK